MFASGIANIFLLKEGKKLTDPIHKMWVHIFELKFVLSLFLTPLVVPMTSLFYSGNSADTVVYSDDSQDIFEA